MGKQGGWLRPGGGGGGEGEVPGGVARERPL